ncbi:MAG: FHA domain-containing protein [Byssovorax sp.]
MSADVLDLSLALDETVLPAGGPSRVHLVAEILARAPGVEKSRPPLSVVLAVDVSGSMVGPPIERVIQSIARIASLLGESDRLGIVAFSDDASEIAPLAIVDAAAKRLLSARARRLLAEGATNIEAGLQRAARMMPARGLHERQAILLLSDGAPNRGLAAASELTALARSFRPDVAVSTLGYGEHHNEDILRAIADGGAGRYHFIADPAVCEIELAQALGAQGDVVAESVELTLTPADRVEIVRFLGKTEARFTAAGLRIAAPDLLSGSRHLIAAELQITPSRAEGSIPVLQAELTYRRAGERETATLRRTLAIGIGDGARAVVPEARARVLEVRSDEARAEAQALADRSQFDGAAAVLRRMIASIEAEPWFTANDGSALGEALEQLRDEAGALQRRPSAEQYRVFRKTQITSLRSDAESTSSPTSRHFAHAVGGALPRATLLTITGDDAGKRIALDQPRMTLGRTHAAQVRIDDANVSRRHAEIVAQNGVFLLIDLGSTNPTTVNGQAISKPWTLREGDVIQVGDVQLRYEETRH